MTIKHIANGLVQLNSYLNPDLVAVARYILPTHSQGY